MGRTGYSILLSSLPRQRGTDDGRVRTSTIFDAVEDQFLLKAEKRKRSQGAQTLYIHCSAQAAFLALSRLVSVEAGTLGTRHRALGTLGSRHRALGTRHTYSHHPELP